MDPFMCFICSAIMGRETNEETREKYRVIVGKTLNLDSQLCYVCCHLLNKLSIFRSICLKRSLEYPVVLSTKGPISLQKSNIQVQILCPEKCNQYTQTYNTLNYQYIHSNDSNDADIDCNDQYVKLEHDNQHEYDNGMEQAESHDLNKDMIDTNGHYDKLINDTDDTDTNFDKHIGDTIVHNIKLEIDNENMQDNDTVSTFDFANTVPVGVNGEGVKKRKGSKSDKGFKRIILTLNKQKAELEANRKKKKYLEAEFKCHNCALGFLFKDTYQAHMMRHEESNGQYQCETCTLRFATPASLRIHAACHSERHVCRTCGAGLRPRAKRSHSCFNQPESQSVACHLCGNLLKDANGLQQHLKRVHASRASGRCYVCSVCGDSYTRQGALRTHMIKHINRKFHCDQCPGIYSSPYTLTQHKKTHRGGGPAHYCDACGAGYATRKSLLAHMRNTSYHQTTTFECPICGRVCPNQKSLASHIQAVHSATKDFTCDLCPARYTNRKSLVRHIGTHRKKTEVKTVVCHLCGTNFKGNSKLNRHLREVCKKTKDQPSAYE